MKFKFYTILNINNQLIKNIKLPRGQFQRVWYTGVQIQVTRSDKEQKHKSKRKSRLQASMTMKILHLKVEDRSLHAGQEPSVTGVGDQVQVNSMRKSREMQLEN